jgi:RNA polymerase sigma-70 factor (ECF subfamily)
MSAIEDVYRSHSHEVYRFARWLSGNAAEADDIVSETFLRLWGSRDDVQVATVKAYLLTIARNVFVSRRRRSGRYERLPEGALDNTPRPDIAAERNDELRALMDGVQRLPEGERAALLLRVQHDLPCEEIARILGVSLSAAKVRVHRARLKLVQWSSAAGGET